MKKALLILASVLVLAGCAKKEPAPAETAEPQTLGGWTVNTKIISNVMTEEQKAVFQKAADAETEKQYQPVAMLASQIVSGTNYAFLALETDAEGSSGWTIVKVYRSLNDQSEISSVSVIDPSDLKTTDTGIKPGLDGGWEVNPARADAIVLDQEVSSAFAEACGEYEEAVLSPLVLIASKVVSGTKYLILAQGTDWSDSSEHIYACDVWLKADNTAEAVNISKLDLLAYLSE